MILILSGGTQPLSADEMLWLKEFIEVRQVTQIYVSDTTNLTLGISTWAQENNLDHTIFSTNWAEYGVKARDVRNQTMAEAAKPNGVVVAFPGPKGTDNMITLGQHFGLEIVDLSQWMCV